MFSRDGDLQALSERLPNTAQDEETEKAAAQIQSQHEREEVQKEMMGRTACSVPFSTSISAFVSSSCFLLSWRPSGNFIAVPSFHTHFPSAPSSSSAASSSSSALSSPFLSKSDSRVKPAVVVAIPCPTDEETQRFQAEAETEAKADKASQRKHRAKEKKRMQ